MFCASCLSEMRQACLISLLCFVWNWPTSAFAQSQFDDLFSEFNSKSNAELKDRRHSREMSCDQTLEPDESTTRWSWVDDLYRCLEDYSDRLPDTEFFDEADLSHTEVSQDAAKLTSRVDALEASADVLEDKSFSTTTKLSLPCIQIKRQPMQWLRISL